MQRRAVVTQAAGDRIDGEGPVVADLVRPAGGRTSVEAVAAPLVVRLPGGVRRLEQEVGGPFVVADHEVRRAGPARVLAREPAEVEAGGGRCRHDPRGRHRPVAGIDQSGRRVGEGTRLDLAEGLGGRDGGHQPRPGALVVAQAVDVDAVLLVGRVVDLERDRLAVVDADIGGEALDGRIAGSDAPGALGGAGQLVLGDYRVTRRQRPVFEAFNPRAAGGVYEPGGPEPCRAETPEGAPEHGA